MKWIRTLEQYTTWRNTQERLKQQHI
jgi:hypothetical protein